MDLRQLEMFLAVSENNSFTLASQELNVAQSAISRKIKMLEDELGEKLFKRVNKRIYLTPAGRTLLRYARRIFREIRNARLEVSEIAELKRGEIKIGAGMIASMYYLPSILEKFRESYPRVELKVVTGSTERLITKLRENRLDIGLLTLPVDFPDLHVIPLFSEEMGVVASAKHPVFAGKEVITSREIGDHPLILFPPGAYTRRLLDKFFQEQGLTPNVSMEAENVATIKPLVRINLGISILPLRSVVEEIEQGELVYLKIADYSLVREQGLVLHKTSSMPNVLSQLVNYFQAAQEYFNTPTRTGAAG